VSLLFLLTSDFLLSIQSWRTCSNSSGRFRLLHRPVQKSVPCLPQPCDKLCLHFDVGLRLLIAVGLMQLD
jgi:hypothetical protein